MASMADKIQRAIPEGAHCSRDGAMHYADAPDGYHWIGVGNRCVVVNTEIQWSRKVRDQDIKNFIAIMRHGYESCDASCLKGDQS